MQLFLEWLQISNVLKMLGVETTADKNNVKSIAAVSKQPSNALAENVTIVRKSWQI